MNIFIPGLISFAAVPTDREKENPFYGEFNTPFGVPPFDNIKEAHYMPAFRKGMALQTEEIEAIVNNSDAPTFENTIEALDYSGEQLARVRNVFFWSIGCPYK